MGTYYTPRYKVVRDFFPLSDYPKSNKKDIEKQLRQEGYSLISYSGKDKGFHAAK